MNHAKIGQGRSIYLDRVNPSCCPDAFAARATAARLANQGWRIVTVPAEAEAVFVHCCGFDLDSQARTRKVIDRWSCEGKLVIVGGCQSTEPELANGLSGTCAVEPCTPDTSPEQDSSPLVLASERRRAPAYRSGFEEWRLVARLYAAGRAEGLALDALRAYLVSGYAYAEGSALVRVARGCLGACTYCAERFTAGRLCSLHPDQIVNCVREAVDAGEKDIALVADDLSAYGLDKGSDLPTLLHRILDGTGISRLRLDNCNPEWLLTHRSLLVPLLSTTSVDYLVVCLQSLNDDVLRRMGRRYQAAHVLDLVAELKRRNPALVITTHVILGFPGETERDVHRLLEWAQSGPSDIVEAFAYRAQPGTEAAEMRGQLPLAVRLERKRVVASVYWARFHSELEQLGGHPEAARLAGGSIHA